MKCIHCNNTGSLSKHLDGSLDCAHCDVADQRVKLEEVVFDLIAEHGAAAAMWLVFQQGRAATAASATN